MKGPPRSRESEIMIALFTARAFSPRKLICRHLKGSTGGSGVGAEGGGCLTSIKSDAVSLIYIPVNAA